MENNAPEEFSHVESFSSMLMSCFPQFLLLYAFLNRCFSHREGRNDICRTRSREIPNSLRGRHEPTFQRRFFVRWKYAQTQRWHNQWARWSYVHTRQPFRYVPGALLVAERWCELSSSVAKNYLFLGGVSFLTAKYRKAPGDRSETSISWSAAPLGFLRPASQGRKVSMGTLSTFANAPRLIRMTFCRIAKLFRLLCGRSGGRQIHAYWHGVWPEALWTEV